MSSTLTKNDSSSSTFRVNYSDYVADITGSPKTTRKSTTTTTVTTGIGHHINPLHNQFPNRQNQPVQQPVGMPQYGGGSEKCARCSKTVYLAEKKVGAGRSFHTSCFSCHTCKRKLDSTGLSEHKGEIYCKSCYTKQFGAHGLISGVTMSTEHPASRDGRSPRRSSYGDDLDTPATTNQQTRQRTYSTDNMIHTEYNVKRNDESPKKYTPTNDISPSKKNDGVNALIDTKYQRSPSPSRVNESNTNNNNNRHRSTYIEEDDRNKYTYEGQKLSYGSGATAMVDIPILYTKRSNSTADNKYEIPVEHTRSNQRSRSPSITSNDSYRRQNSHDRQTDFTNDYSRLHINEDVNNNNNRLNRKSSNDNTINNIPSQNPMTTRNFYHSSSTSSTSQEMKYRNSTSNPNDSDRNTYHSRESSPVRVTTRDRSPSPVPRYTSSTTYRAGSPSSTFVPQYDHRNSQTSSTANYNTQRSSSPSRQTNNRTSSGLNDFVSKTNLAGNISSSDSDKNSALTALVANIRRHHNSNDDDFDN